MRLTFYSKWLLPPILAIQRPASIIAPPGQESKAYRVLGVSPAATPAEVKAAYRRKVRCGF